MAELQTLEQTLHPNEMKTLHSSSTCHSLRGIVRDFSHIYYTTYFYIDLLHTIMTLVSYFNLLLLIILILPTLSDHDIR